MRLVTARRRAARDSVRGVIHNGYPDLHDDTSADYEQFEKELLAKDRDIAGVDTQDIDGRTARSLVDDLIDADVVTPIPEECVLVHEPSGTAFDSTTQLAVYHRGWTAGHDADVEDG